ncbi:hypothetical protein Q7A53_05910 [Halobacillus rhizosphaerae]|uniref:hypothetical protein n=1 Tax=Halobacillus rhizosphaerae TaxID=3064889 RepID=UPI00398A900A
MENMKFGWNTVFDVKLSEDTGEGFTLVHNLDSLYKVNIYSSPEMEENYLELTDSFIDIALMEDVLNGKYKNRALRLEAETIVRDSDGNDYVCTYNISELYLSQYSVLSKNLNDKNDSLGRSKLEFTFPTKVNSFDNVRLTVKEKVEKTSCTYGVNGTCLCNRVKCGFNCTWFDSKKDTES